MKFLILLLPLLAFSLSSGIIQERFDAHEYSEVCTKDVENFLLKTNDEALMSIYGMACLKIHKINSLFLPTIKLRTSKEARENAAYFADIMFKKKLLYHALLDGIDISYIRLPKSDYILSMIFDKFVKKQYTKNGNKFIFNEKYSDVVYELYKVDELPVSKMILAIYQNGKIIEKIEYY